MVASSVVDPDPQDPLPITWQQSPAPRQGVAVGQLGSLAHRYQLPDSGAQLPGKAWRQVS